MSGGWFRKAPSKDIRGRKRPEKETVRSGSTALVMKADAGQTARRVMRGRFLQQRHTDMNHAREKQTEEKEIKTSSEGD